MDISAIYYDGWKDLVRIALAAPVIYFTIIAFIRLAGKRSTSQMNNFDWVVTVALGSIHDFWYIGVSTLCRIFAMSV